jgi:hypothetical protein
MADGQAAKPFRPLVTDLSLDVDFNLLHFSFFWMVKTSSLGFGLESGVAKLVSERNRSS